MNRMDVYYDCMSSNNTNLATLDLNLITALSALLEHRSVSNAAEAVGRTQSAMSHSLSRLREHFRDPILVRDGWNMRLTPMAERLRPRVVEAARSARLLFELETDFDPASSNRRIRIAAPDLCASLFTQFIGDVSRQAPGMSVVFTSNSSVRQAVLNSEAEIGLGFGLPKPDPNLVVHPLEPMAWCTFAPRDHAFSVDGSNEIWAASQHIVVGQDDSSEGPVEKAMRKQGFTRHVLCHASNFSAALSLAAENNALFTTLRAPFMRTAKRLGLVACQAPFSMSEASAVLMFRADYGDPFSIWLRTLCLRSID